MAQNILENEPEILRSEVESLKAAKTGKALGIDGITDRVETVHNNTYMETEGDRRECSQYRDTSLLSQPSKVFASIL